MPADDDGGKHFNGCTTTSACRGGPGSTIQQLKSDNLLLKTVRESQVVSVSGMHTHRERGPAAHYTLPIWPRNLGIGGVPS